MTTETLLPAPPVRERLATALKVGGRARVTVTSRSTGKHLTVVFAAKKRGDDGRFVSRQLKVGRVGIKDAACVFVDGGDTAFGGWVCTLDLATGEWRSPKGYDDERGPHYAWAAQHALAWALSADGDPAFEAQAEVALASECMVCGKALTDPVSIAEDIGPECKGRATGSKHV